MPALQGYTPAALQAARPELTLTEARKLVSAVHRVGSLVGPVRQVRRANLEGVRAWGTLPTLTVVSRQASGRDPFVKLALRAPDGQLIETVRIPLEKAGRYSACVSAQVGCALGCVFCATGRLGLRRNLETWEIVEQVRWVRASLADLPGGATARVHGVVFQGMGEPLVNLEAVLRAIEVLSDPCAQAIDARNITVSTVGIPAGIRRLARAAPKVRLAWSLHAVDRTLRARLLPIESHHPLDEVVDAGVEHARLTRRAPMWSVTLLAGVNDQAEHAARLVALVEAFTERAGIRPRLSIIPYNPIGPGGDAFRRPGLAAIAGFRAILHARTIPTHLRYSGGGDVSAACGQLAGVA